MKIIAAKIVLLISYETHTHTTFKIQISEVCSIQEKGLLKSGILLASAIDDRNIQTHSKSVLEISKDLRCPEMNFHKKEIWMCD